MLGLVGAAHQLNVLLGHVHAVFVHAGPLVAGHPDLGRGGLQGLPHGAGGRVPVLGGGLDIFAQSLLKGDVFHLVVGGFRVDNIVGDGALLGPLEAHGLLQHNHGVGCEKIRHRFVLPS